MGDDCPGSLNCLSPMAFSNNALIWLILYLSNISEPPICIGWFHVVSCLLS